MPALAIVLILFVSRRRGLSWRDDLALRRPRPRALMLALLVWIVWIALSEVIINAFGLEQAKAWPPYGPLVVGLRILAIGILGPIAEELVMRGLFVGILRKTRLGSFGAVVVVALAWAAMHFQYGAWTLVLIALDGVLLGLARERGGSLWLPIAMHVLGNLVSIGQSLAA